MAEMPVKHVVIIGGGFGGLHVARGLAGAPVEVTLVDRQNHHLFQPLLYQVATSGLSPAEIAVPIRSVVGRQKNVEVLLGEVESVDLDRRAVRLRDGMELRYDYVVIAAGAKTSYFGQDRWAEHAHGLKDIRDALRIRERVLLAFEAAERERDEARRAELLTFVVVGGGPTGVEMAGAVAELGRFVLSRDFRRVSPADVRVVLVEMADRLLLPFHPDVSRKAKRQLEELGVDVRLNTRVTDVSEAGVVTAEGLIPASTVVWAPGVRPVALAERVRGAQLEHGRILVDGRCSLPHRPDAFAIGDIAWFVPEGSPEPLPGLGAVAVQQGKFVARAIRAEVAGRPRRTFRYRDRGVMATIGRKRAVAQFERVRLSGFSAWLAWLFIHLMLLVGFRNRVMVLLEWFWQYIAFRRGARLITRRAPSPAVALADAGDTAGETDRSKAA